MDNGRPIPHSLEQQMHPTQSKPFADSVGPVFWLSLGWIALVAMLALSADLLPLAAYDLMDFDHPAAPPGTQRDVTIDTGNQMVSVEPYTYLLGTDTMGRDIISRLIYGARVSLAVAFAGPFIGLIIGGILGMTAGYFRGRTEAAILFVMDTLLAFPGLVLLLAITYYLGSSLQNIIIALGILSVPSFSRVSRANTIKYADRDFVQAARMAGRSDLGILIYEILPNVIMPVIVYALIVVAYMIVAEGVLSYLGLGVPSPMPSWGGMIAEGKEVLEDASHVSLIPALVMFVTVLSFNLIGDALRSFFDARQGQL